MGAFVLIGLLASVVAFAAFDIGTDDGSDERPNDDDDNDDGDRDLVEMVGTDGDDKVLLSEKLLGNTDVYRALDGDDYIYGKANQELSAIYGGAGNDYIRVETKTDQPLKVSGGTGNDAIYDADIAYGGDGSDTIYGGNIYGESGNDKMHGAQVYGGDGDDIIYSQRFSDSQRGAAYGGSGNDTIFVGNEDGGDFLGGEGHDVFVIGPQSTDNLNEVVISDFDKEKDRLVVQLTSDKIKYGVGEIRPEITIEERQGDTIINVEWPDLYANKVVLKEVIDFSLSKISFIEKEMIGRNTGYGPVFLDQMQGTSENDIWTNAEGFYYFGGDGNDTIESAERGTLWADLGNGDDTFIGNGAEVFVHGGDGNDTYIENAGEPAVIIWLENEPWYHIPIFSGDAGNDTMILHSVNGGTYLGGEGDDLITVEEGNAHALVSGGQGNDTIIAESGTDIISGNGEGDQITLNISAEDLTTPYLRSNIYDFHLAQPGSFVLNLDSRIPGTLRIVLDGNYNGDGLYGSHRSKLYMDDNLIVTFHGDRVEPVQSLDDPRLTINYV